MSSRIIVNKHISNPELIVESAFTEDISRVTGAPLREGEVIICSNDSTPGVYIHTVTSETSPNGRIIKVNDSSNITRGEGKLEVSLETMESDIDSLKNKPGVEIKGTEIITYTEPTIGKDGKLHQAGTYLVIEFKSVLGVSTFAYSDFNVSWDGTQEEYDALGTYDANKTYYIHES